MGKARRAHKRHLATHVSDACGKAKQPEHLHALRSAGRLDHLMDSPSTKPRPIYRYLPEWTDRFLFRQPTTASDVPNQQSHLRNSVERSATQPDTDH